MDVFFAIGKSVSLAAPPYGIFSAAQADAYL